MSVVVFIVAVTSQDLQPIKTQQTVKIQLYQRPMQDVNCPTFLINVLDWQSIPADDTQSANSYIQTSAWPYNVSL